MDNPTRDLVQAAKYQRRLELRARLAALCREPEPMHGDDFKIWSDKVRAIQDELRRLGDR